MKQILSISDSYEGTNLDVKRTVATIKAYEMEPLIAVSEYIHRDGTVDPGQIEETLDFCFDECEPAAVFVGFIHGARSAATIARQLRTRRPSIIVSDPSIISDKGEVWMSEETYNVISTAIFDLSSYIVINHLEAELLAGLECRTQSDFERAAKKLRHCFDAAIYIKGCDRTDNRGLYCDSQTIEWVAVDRSKADPGLSLGNALNCELALGVTGIKALTNAIYFTINGRRVSDSIPVPQVAPTLISPAKSIRDIARSIDLPDRPQAQPKPAKTSIIDPITEGTKGTVSEIKATGRPASGSVSSSLSELAEMRKRLEALKLKES